MIDQDAKEELKENVSTILVVVITTIYFFKMPRPRAGPIPIQQVTWEMTGVYVQILTALLLLAIYVELSWSEHDDG